MKGFAIFKIDSVWNIVYRGYYTVARRYKFYVLVARTISHSFASLTREILFLPREHKIHIFEPPCNILYLSLFSQLRECMYMHFWHFILSLESILISLLTYVGSDRQQKVSNPWCSKHFNGFSVTSSKNKQRHNCAKLLIVSLTFRC